MIVFHSCYLVLLWNVVLKCLALCLITIISAYFLQPICLPHLLICTCLISSPIACPPTYVLCWCLLRFFLVLIYATFLCDSILDCLWFNGCYCGPFLCFVAVENNPMRFCIRLAHLVFFATNVHLDRTHKYHRQTSSDLIRLHQHNTLL